MPTPKGQGLLARWSYSQWSSYEKCPAMVKYRQIDKLPEIGPREALDRGNHIHRVLEDVVRCKAPLETMYDPVPGKPSKLPTWVPEVETLLREGATAEDSISLTQSWTETTWLANDAWLRAKLDVRLKPKVIDYKTGRAYPEHVYQADLYATMEYAIGCQAPEIPVEFWYLDQPADGKNAKKVWYFKKEDQPQRVLAWEHRIEAMMNDTLFPKRPGMHCAWCGYAGSKGGPCEAG